MLRDIRYALRTLLQHKGWTLVVLLSLAVGIGANAAIFSGVNGLIFRTLPVEDPGTLVRLRTVGPSAMGTNFSEYGYLTRQDGAQVGSTFPYPIYQALRESNDTLQDLFAGAPIGTLNVIVDGQAQVASGYIASGNYHEMLGIRPAIGRLLMPGDDRPDAEPVAVISAGYWSRRFGGEPDVVGRVIRVNGVVMTIVGVEPPSFTGVERVVDAFDRDLTFPLALDTRVNAQPGGDGTRPARLESATTYWLQIVGRLRPGVTAAQVEGDFAGVFEQTARRGMAGYLDGLSEQERARVGGRNSTDVPRLQVTSATHGTYDTREAELRSVRILSGVVVLILLLVCANVANLLLSRAAARQKELSVRLSMGATRARLVRQLLTESLVLALVGAAGGVLVALWGRRLLPGGLGLAPLDWRVFGFTAGLAVASAALFGLVPALRATGRRVHATLKDTSRTLALSRTMLGRGLLVAQVTIALVLLVGTGLFLRTVANLQQVNVGFNTDNLLLAYVDPRLNGYQGAGALDLLDRIAARVRAVPGVRDATFSNVALLSGGVSSTEIYRPGQQRGDGVDHQTNRLIVASNFFQTMEIPLRRGRGFADLDRTGMPRPIILNEVAARKFFQDQDPLDQLMGSSPMDAVNGQMRVVGVVADAHYNSLRDGAPPTLYEPLTPNNARLMALNVRTIGDPLAVVGALRAAVSEVDPDLPLQRVQTQLQAIDGRVAEEQVFARAGLLFGGLALLMASVGLYGLMSYSVARRTNEIGIRMALGAGRNTVVRMIMSESLGLVLVGVGLGIVGAAVATRLIAGQLFGVATLDPVSFVGAVVVLVAVSALAGYWPARRASRVDPSAALQHE